MRLATFALTIVASAALAAPALAQDVPAPVTDAEGRVYGGPPGAPLPAQPDWRAAAQAPQQGPGYSAEYARAREDWLTECRRRRGSSGLAGGLIGGVVGGIAGNVIAGHDDRTLGTVAGAVVGGVAGAAIDRGTSARRARDECETYLDQYTQQPAYGYGAGYYGQGYPGYGYAPAYGYTYAVPMMMVPAAQQVSRPCVRRIVTTEWVNVPVRQRIIAPRRHVYHDKRVRMVPDKRIPMK